MRAKTSPPNLSQKHFFLRTGQIETSFLPEVQFETSFFPGSVFQLAFPKSIIPRENCVLPSVLILISWEFFSISDSYFLTK